MRQNMKYFFLILFFPCLSFSYQTNLDRVFNFGLEDIYHYQAGSKQADSQGGVYLIYPKVCFNDSSANGRALSNFIKNYTGYRTPNAYREPSYVIAEKKCGQVDYYYTSNSVAIFNLDLFPNNTKFWLEVYFFSNTGNATSSSGNYDVSDGEKPRALNYLVFQNTDSSYETLLSSLGTVATMSQKYPVGISGKFLENIKAEYNLGKIRNIESGVTVDINVEGGFFNKNYYGDNNFFNPNYTTDYKFIHYRLPFLFSPNFAPISTVYSVRLSLPVSEATRICGDFATDYSILKAKIDESDRYTQIIHSILNESSSDLYVTIAAYYYKTQKEIENTIKYMRSSLPESTEKELLIEGLSTISILQSNNCLKSLNMDLLQTDKKYFLNRVNSCYQNKQISGENKKLLDQLANLSVTGHSVSENFETQIKKIASEEANKRQDLSVTKRKIKNFYNQTIKNPNLQKSCKLGMGESRFNEIIGSN